jgi:hypothetical protein
MMGYGGWGNGWYFAQLLFAAAVGVAAGAIIAAVHNAVASKI